MEGEEAEVKVLFNTLAPAFRIVVVVRQLSTSAEKHHKRHVIHMTKPGGPGDPPLGTSRATSSTLHIPPTANANLLTITNLKVLGRT